MILRQLIARDHRGASGDGDPYWDKVVYALHFDGSNGSTDLVDEKGATWYPQKQAALSVAEKKFGSASLDLSASSQDFAYTSGLDYRFGDDDFTVDFWSWLKSLPATPNLSALVSARTNSGPVRGWQFTLRSDSLAFTAWDASSNAFVDFGSSEISIAAEQWHHLAVTRQGSSWRIFFNGVLIGSATAAGTIGNCGWLRIGADPSSSSRFLDAYVDDFRVTKGAARWTDDFSVPTAPFPNHG